MVRIASAAPSVVIAHIAAGTRTIRVGAGGSMLPNHAPIVIAEQFGTLARLFPDRIDLGPGRAPDTDQMTTRALRRTFAIAERFPARRVGAPSSLGARAAGSTRPGGAGGRNGSAAMDSGVQYLRSSTRGELGLAYAFASHFAPDQLLPALDIYRGSNHRNSLPAHA
jgi:hypothetical protein